MKVAHSTTSSTDTAHVTPLPRRTPGASMHPATMVRPLPGPVSVRASLDARFNRDVYAASFDRIGQPAAFDAFGASDDDNRKVIPSLPNPRKPIDVDGAA